MAENGKKIVLTVKQKLQLLEKFENGESVTELAKDYGVEIK
jgi:Mor family transcriptional regulator